MENNYRYQVEFTEECRNEIRKIYRYIKDNLHNKSAAEKLISKLQNYIETLKRSPRIYAEIDIYKGTEKVYRKMIVNKYIVLYNVNEENKKAIIAHMFYGGSNYTIRI